MNDAQQHASQHQTNRNLRRNPGAARLSAVKIRNFRLKPTQIQNLINPNKHMVRRQKVPQRPRHKQFRLTTILVAQHGDASQNITIESKCQSFFNRPGRLV
jgi:hypothetical protein